MKLKISYFLRLAYWISIYFTNHLKTDNSFESKIIFLNLCLATQSLGNRYAKKTALNRDKAHVKTNTSELKADLKIKHFFLFKCCL